MALPGGLAFFVMPAMIYFLIPESARWYLRRGHTAVAVETVNRIIQKAGNRVPALTVATLGSSAQTVREELPPYRAVLVAASCAGWQSGSPAVSSAALPFF